MNYLVIFLILIGFAGSLQLSFAEINYPDAIRIPFNDSDLVLVGTIISKDEISKNQTKYGIDVEDYLKNSKSFDMISAISYETKNQTEPYTEVHYYNEPFFDVGQKVFVYLALNKNGEYIMSPYSFAIEKNEPKGPPPSVIWMTGPTKFQFNQGEEVIISGLIKKAYLYDSIQRGQDPSINLKILDKNNEIMVSEKLNAKIDGTFEYPFQIKAEPRIPGKYSYEIQFGPETMNGEFVIDIKPNLWAPLKQFKSGIPIEKIQCKENLQLIIKNNGNPACVKSTSLEKLYLRGWGDCAWNCSHPIPENLMDEDCPVSFMDKTKYKIPKHDSNVIVEPESPITSWGELFSSFEEAQKYAGINGISLPANIPDCLKLDSIRATTGSMGEKFLTIVYLLEGIKPSGYYTLTNATEQGLTIQIIRDSAFVFQYNDDYVKTQAEENKNLGWNFTKQGSFPVLLKNRNAEFNIPSEVNTIINHQSIMIRSYILEINELEKIFRSMFG